VLGVSASAAQTFAHRVETPWCSRPPSTFLEQGRPACGSSSVSVLALFHCQRGRLGPFNQTVPQNDRVDLRFSGRRPIAVSLRFLPCEGVIFTIWLKSTIAARVKSVRLLFLGTSPADCPQFSRHLQPEGTAAMPDPPPEKSPANPKAQTGV